MQHWRDVPGFETLYQVSSQGRVRSLDRVVQTGTGPRRYVGGELTPTARNKSGHLSVNLRGVSTYVHDLVMRAHGPERPPGAEIRHLNTVSTDNRIENLAWGSRSENSKDLTRMGRRLLTYAQAENIRLRHEAGETQADIARTEGLGHTHVQKICAGEIYVR